MPKISLSDPLEDPKLATLLDLGRVPLSVLSELVKNLLEPLPKKLLFVPNIESFTTEPFSLLTPLSELAEKSLVLLPQKKPLPVWDIEPFILESSLWNLTESFSIFASGGTPPADGKSAALRPFPVIFISVASSTGFSACGSTGLTFVFGRTTFLFCISLRRFSCAVVFFCFVSTTFSSILFSPTEGWLSSLFSALLFWSVFTLPSNPGILGITPLFSVFVSYSSEFSCENFSLLYGFPFLALIEI